MPTADIVTLAEAVKDRIQTGSYSQSVNVVRAWARRLELPELAELQVTVSPGLVATESSASVRSMSAHQYPMVVAIHRQIGDPNKPDEADALALLTEQIADRLLRWAPENFRWLSIEYPGMPNLSALQTNVWEAFITVTYQGWRE